ncbi:MAG: RnfABCDGE type electron transport complex subunit C, partial [Candidatus Omnitrophica bacterium]|nr:RnfABCDGE type electron transport complex subunit C [Candidatus Omnitrophota bacterium]
KTQEILKGIEIIVKILRPDETYIAVEDNKKAAFFAFQKLLEGSARKAARIRVALVKTKYPQGGEKQLIKAIAGREVPPGKLPLDIGFLVQNAGTVHAVYEAVYLDKPLIERIVTFSGDCLESPGNYLVRVGATIRETIERSSMSIRKEPAKVIVGGPMMGFAQPDLESPVLKCTSGVLLLSEKYAGDFEEGQCIRCAKCVDVCPVNLEPTEIMRNVKKGNWDKMEGLWISDCMECGACSYACPARIPLVQYIKVGKNALRQNKK